jgi:hypothetical protein
MDDTSTPPIASSEIWLAATIAEGRVVRHRPARPGPEQPGTLAEQHDIARLAAENPWHYCDFADAMRAARRTVLQHARRR